MLSQVSSARRLVKGLGAIMQHMDDMNTSDYYALLGVDRTSPPEAITRAYRRLARQSHPDLHPEDAEAGSRFKTINEAYQVLSDPVRRADYDRRYASASSWRPASSSPAATPAHTSNTPDAGPGGHEPASIVQEEGIVATTTDLAGAVEELA